jgi:hypothetical protein
MKKIKLKDRQEARLSNKNGHLKRKRSNKKKWQEEFKRKGKARGGEFREPRRA